MACFRDVLANRDFFLLWVGQLISNFGDRLNQMALVALVYQRAPGSELELAKLISFTIIPVFLIGPVAGVWADRFDRRRTMVAADIIRAFLVLSIPFWIHLDRMPPVYLAVFLSFALARFFLPSKMALIPEIVPREHLLVANTLTGMTNMIGNVAGLVIAGWLVTMPRVGAIGGFYIDAATFIVSAMLVGFMVRPVLRAPPVAGAGASPRRTVVEEIRQGVGLLAEYRPMRFVIGSFLLLMAGLGSISCVIIIFIQDAYATPTRDLGFLGMWLVVGLFGGTVLYGKFCQRWKRRMTAYGSFAAAGMGIIIFTIVVGLRMDIVFACAIAAFIGAAASPLMVIANTITHETVPEAARGRIFSSLEVVIHLSFLACMFAAAFAARHAGRSVVLVSVGILFLVAGLGGAGRERGKTTST